MPHRHNTELASLHDADLTINAMRYIRLLNVTEIIAKSPRSIVSRRADRENLFERREISPHLRNYAVSILVDLISRLSARPIRPEEYLRLRVIFTAVTELK